ncbi:MAG: DUF6057 family protein [Candidatus Latescibacterota bacterium]
MQRTRLHPLSLPLLFALCFATYAWVLDYVILVQYESPASYFVFDRQFLAQWLDHPGGLVLYAGRFLRQFFHFEWLGALVISSLAVLLALLLYGIRGRLGQSPTAFHTLAPCILVVALYSASTFTVGLVAACAAFLLYLALPAGGARQACALLSTPALYLAAGGFSWLFVAWVTLGEWLARPTGRSRVFAVLYPALALCLPLVAHRWLFPVSLRAAWLYPFDLPQALHERVLLGYLLLTPAWPRLPVGARLESFLRSAHSSRVQCGLLLALGVLLVALVSDPAARQFARLHRLYRQGQWDRILEEVRRHPSSDVMTQFFTDHALCRRGRLLDEMFRYPQAWGTRGLVLNFPGEAEQLRQAMYDSDLYFALGHVNAAYRMAYNQIGFLGPAYASMRRMVECNVANGSFEIALKHVRILERTLFHRGFARQYRALVADPAAAERHFAALRERRPTVELDVNLGEFAALLALVKSSPRNRMAFDYLTAWCLLDKAALPFVVENLPGFRQAGYAALPLHCQEALLVWESLSSAPVERLGYAYSAGVGARFAEFGRLLGRLPAAGDLEGTLKPAFGGTYMYYYAVTATPLEGTPTWAWYRLGNELFAQGSLEEAAACFQQALLKHPEAAETYPRAGALVKPAPGPSAPSRPESEWQLRSH